MEIRLTLSLPREEISIPVVRRLCAQSLRVLGVSGGCAQDVELALAEACANVLLHATQDDQYEVTVGVDDRVAVIEVVDHGGGIDLAAALAGAPAPGALSMIVPTPETLPEQGRGILLMRALMDSVQLHRLEGDRQGTHVHLEKTLEWDETAPVVRLGRLQAEPVATDL